MAKKKRFADIDSSLFEKEHVMRIDNYSMQVDRIFELAAKEYAVIASTILNPDPYKEFLFSEYPQTNEAVNKVLKAVYTSLNTIITNGYNIEWLASTKNNDKLVDAIFSTSKLSKKQLGKYYSPNLEALSAFQERKVNGRKISEAVWTYTKQFRDEAELSITEAISKKIDKALGAGTSAADLSQTIRKNLKEPNKLFRRVKDKNGNLVMSKNAKAYETAPGVYKSSYKNAMRLTRTETNMAYRASDYLRWNQLDFIVGIEIRLSNRNNHCPLCDALKGIYPKEFKFIGWHPQCLCAAISIRKTDEELDIDDVRMLQGKEPLVGSVNQVKDVPDGFKQWIEDNKEKASRAKNTPFWILDNFNEGNLEKGLKFQNS